MMPSDDALRTRYTWPASIRGLTIPWYTYMHCTSTTTVPCLYIRVAHMHVSEFDKPKQQLSTSRLKPQQTHTHISASALYHATLHAKFLSQLEIYVAYKISNMFKMYVNVIHSRDTWKRYLSRTAVHCSCWFCVLCTNTLTYLLTYLFTIISVSWLSESQKYRRKSVAVFRLLLPLSMYYH